MKYPHIPVTVRFSEAYQLNQTDLLNFVHTNEKFDDLMGCDVYGIALAYIKNLEHENQRLLLRIKLYESVEKILKS
jgi:hypothetical protein